MPTEVLALTPADTTTTSFSPVAVSSLLKEHQPSTWVTLPFFDGEGFIDIGGPEVRCQTV